MEFHETEYGRRFFGQQLPDLIDALKDISTTMLDRPKVKEELINLGAQIRSDFPDLTGNYDDGTEIDSVQNDYLSKIASLIKNL